MGLLKIVRENMRDGKPGWDNNMETRLIRPTDRSEVNILTVHAVFPHYNVLYAGVTRNVWSNCPFMNPTSIQ